MGHKVREKDTTVKVLIKGRNGMFTDPLNRITAEKISYPIPTYSAIQGIMRSIYSDYSITWVIDECRVLNRIEYDAMPIINPYKDNKGDRVTYQYLYDCAYLITAHYVFNYALVQYSDRWSYGEHDRRLKAAIQAGGKMDICLGCSECMAFLEDIPADEMPGWYDGSGTIDMGMMFHSYKLPTKHDPFRYALYWNAVMEDGTIRFCKPDDCDVKRRLRYGKPFMPQDDRQPRKEEHEPQLRIISNRRKSYQE